MRMHTNTVILDLQWTLHGCWLPSPHTPSHATLRNALPHNTTPRHASPRHASPYYVSPYHTTQHLTTPCLATSHHDTSHCDYCVTVKRHLSDYFFLFVHFLSVLLFETGSLCMAQNSLCRPQWPRTQRYAYLCLINARIRGMCHHTPTIPDLHFY